MKYVRTKDGRILSKSKIICSAFREEYISPDWNDDIEKYLQTKIVAEAGTIEELCDEFVEKWKDYHKGYYYIVSNLHIRRINNEVKRGIKNIQKGELEIYGAIWTDKGLIYVAKANEKGELELL